MSNLENPHRRKFIKSLGAVLLGVGIGGCIKTEPTVKKNSYMAGFFFKNSNLRIDRLTDDSVSLIFRAPEPIFCSFIYGETAAYGRMSFEKMTSALRVHKIKIENLRPKKEYHLRLQAVTRELNIYMSPDIPFSLDTPKIETIPEGYAPQEIPLESILPSEPEVEELMANYARIRFHSFRPIRGIALYGKTQNYGSGRCMSTINPSFEHQIQLIGLEKNQHYYYQIAASDPRGSVYVSRPYTFTTIDSKGYAPPGENIALLSEGARIAGASSSIFPEYAADFAIDGDPATKWATVGDGNNAWIEILFDRTRAIHALGYWTDTMGDSGQVFTFRVVTDKGEVLGPFNVPDAMRPYYYEIPLTKAKKVRFEILESNGGNTGAISISAYTKSFDI